MLKVQKLRADHLLNPMGIDNRKPRLNWQLVSDCKNLIQCSYRIIASHCPNFSELVWDSGKAESGQSLYVTYSSECQRIVYIAGGKDEEEYLPSFISAGFRYALIEG